MAEKNYVEGKVIVITGASSGFGLEIGKQCAALGGKVVLAARRENILQEAAKEITEAGGTAAYKATDVTDYQSVKALADYAVETFGAIDVMINNAGTMPLAYFADHEKAIDAWNKCIDINIKGVVNGISAVYDQMIKQGRGHIINVSSTYGYHPVAGSGVYQATKIAVRYITGSLRQENQGKIKTTIVNPTGVPTTGLFGTVINVDGISGIVSKNTKEFGENFNNFQQGTLPAEKTDVDNIQYWAINAADLAKQVVNAINQPWGVDISEVTVRASGENYIL